MGQLSSDDYTKLKDMLTDLAGVVDQLKGNSKSFVEDQISRHEKYGDRMFISMKQTQWLRDLHSEYVGTVAHATPKEEREVGEEDDDRGDDMNDEIKF